MTSMRLPRFQFGLRTLFVLLTAAAGVAWWPNYGRPLYRSWHARRSFRQALHAGDFDGFVSGLEGLETIVREQSRDTNLWQGHGIAVPPERLPVDEALADECIALFSHPAAKVRVVASLAVSLIRRQPQVEVPRLCKMLDDPSPDARAMAAYGLVFYGEAAKPAVPELVHLYKTASGADSSAAFAALVDLDPRAATSASGAGISWMRGSWGQAPSEVAAHFLSKLDPSYRLRWMERYERLGVDDEIKKWTQRLNAAESESDRDLCHLQIGALKSDLHRLHDDFAALRVESVARE